MSEQEQGMTPEQQEQETNAALSAGYNKARGEPAEVPKEDKPAVAETETAAPEPAKVEPEKAPDPWEGVPAVVRETLEGIKGKFGILDGLAHEVKSQTGRVAAIQREMAAAKAAAAKVENAPTDEQITAAAASPEKWEKLKQLFKDWSEEMDLDGFDDRITQRLAAERAEVLKQVPKVDVDGLTKNFNDALANAIAVSQQRTEQRIKAFNRITKQHPTWADDIYLDSEAPKEGFKPEFAAWKNAQAPEIQALGDSNKAADAIKMLDLFYDHQKAAAKREQNKQRLASVVTPPQASSGGPTVLEPEAGLSIGYNRVKKRA